jgi:hypothetical protein
MLADYYITYDKQNYTMNFNASVKSKENPYGGGGGGDDRDYYNIGGGRYNKWEVDPHIDFIKNPEEGETSEWWGYSYKYEDGKFWREGRVEGEAEWVETTKEQMVKEGRLSKQVKLPKGIYSNKNPEIVREEEFNGVKAIDFIDMDIDDVVRNLNKHYYTLKKPIGKTKDNNYLAIYINGEWGKYKKPTNEKELDRLLRILSGDEFIKEIGETELNTDYN